MDPDLIPSPVVPIKNRPGLFAVVTRDTAKRIKEGYWKLYLVGTIVMVETASRNRRALRGIDPYHGLVFFAIDQDGKLVTDLGG